MKNILVIDAQGGGVGKQLVAGIKSMDAELNVTAVGTNVSATEAMLRAGADRAATGENSVVVACRSADIIIGPIGVVIADAMLGEITPAMALAVAQAPAKRILLPFNNCDNIVAGITEGSPKKLIAAALAELKEIL